MATIFKAWYVGVVVVEVAQAEEVMFTARAATRAYVVLGICVGNPAIFAIIVMICRPELFYSWLPALAIGVATTSFTFVWLRAFYIQVNEDDLVYKTLFTFKHRVRLSEISTVKQVVNFNPWKYPGRPVNRLEVYTNSSRTPQFCINLKVFHPQDIKNLLQLLKKLKGL